MERIDSDSVGDPARHAALDDLERRLLSLPPAPRDRGRVALIVSRRDGGRREVLARTRLEAGGGLPGDRWGQRPEPHPERAITVMQIDVAELIANGQPLALFGDKLFLALDLSSDNLPTGSRLRVGAAILEVTPMPHDGCRKFRGRFGGDALRLVANARWRRRNLRGIYVCTIESGDAAAGDPVEVLVRASPGSPAA